MLLDPSFRVVVDRAGAGAGGGQIVELSNHLAGEIAAVSDGIGLLDEKHRHDILQNEALRGNRASEAFSEVVVHLSSLPVGCAIPTVADPPQVGSDLRRGGLRG